MRWDRLFGEVEESAADVMADERDTLAEELGAEAWAEMSWTDLLAGDVVLALQGGGEVRGAVLWSSPDLVMVSAGGREVAVARDAVMTAVASGRGAATARRVGWPAVFRAAREDAEDVQVVRRDGGTVSGPVVAVVADAVVLVEGGRRKVIPWTALASVRRH
ncbi:hypothetical protein BHE97_01130 [Aeromicrobium sp. PE09-221]|uniref:hypothetical protein n=1 Tax=Aeromicrobium sp. PE09-221 TaxID=1898043 RepID=UPI000B3EDF29|nr:hypothetical protein [Aeromicrobium sp. PE09-221]OUZ12837.1 hypothetical protein BHE97_01130 [Aeromicrobium sp. PE09-221]